MGLILPTLMVLVPVEKSACVNELGSKTNNALHFGTAAAPSMVNRRGEVVNVSWPMLWPSPFEHLSPKEPLSPVKPVSPVEHLSPLEHVSP